LDLSVKVLILTLGFFAVEGGEHMTTNRSGLQLIGEVVTVSYVADPSLGHGKFRIENHGATTVTAMVESAWLDLAGARQPLASVSVYDLNLERMVNPKGFKVDGGATMKFLVGFPKLVYEPRFGETTAIGLRVIADHQTLEATSPVVFERRIPKIP